MPPGTGRSDPPQDRVTVECTASFYEASARASAFVFHQPGTATRFTIHAAPRPVHRRSAIHADDHRARRTLPDSQR
jgi:hypothetical protein